MSSVLRYDEEALEDFQEFLRSGSFTKVFFLVDENTHEHCLIPLLREIEEIGDTEVLEVEAGEESKSPEVLFQLWMALSELGADRHSLLVNVGGGMICDLGGFLAGTYMRGIAVVHFPTSLLSQVDASIGGKTGINLQHLKNKVGLFLEAERVYLLHRFLETLPYPEVRSGYAEMLKHGLIADRAYWEQLISINITGELPSSQMIRSSIGIKSGVVQQDFRESGLRKILNFGHTLGHALETVALENQSPLLHGEAIALGMVGELLLSSKFGGLEESEAYSAINEIQNRFRDIRPIGDVDRQFEVVRQDKKNRGDSLLFTLLSGLGQAQVDIEVPEQAVREVLQYLKSW